MGIFTKWFNEISKKDIGIAGGKGANLGEMFQAGFPVPPGFIVTADAYWKFLTDTKVIDEITNELKGLNVDDNDSLQEASKKIQEIISNEKMPPEISKEISEMYHNLKIGFESKRMNDKTKEMVKSIRESPFVAVRSSATAEDLPTASFAGQQETYLNVQGADKVVEAVQKCWASLFTARAIYYREKNNFPHMKVKIAVVIEKMINSEISGVAFSANPATSNRDEIVIEAGYGLGEAIVQGIINPNLYIIDKNNISIKDKEVKKQDKMLIRNDLGKNEWLPVPPEKQELQILDDKQVLQLAKMIKDIETHYEFPQDIEWAVENNRLYIVQSRPITTLGNKRTGETMSEEQKSSSEDILHGLGASPGVATGIVSKVKDPSELDKVKQGNIMVTRMTDPNMVPAMKRAAGIITDEGGMTCHAAIVSRELGIPCIVGTGKATSILNDGDEVTLDATNGVVYKGKKEEILSVRSEAPVQGAVQPGMEFPSYYRKIVTGTEIHVNLSTPELADKVSMRDVDGVGLLRAEFIAADLNIHPSALIKQGRGQEFIDKFAKEISKVARLFNPRPVTYRALDFKTNEYKDLPGGAEFEPEERNPMIGWRGASRYVSPDYIETFKLELEALKKVRYTYGMTNVELMIPFVRNTWELKKIYKIIEDVGLKNSGLKVGIMVEVPSAVILIDKFCELGIDFISIGSNDLTQLVLGVDRDNGKLGDWFDERDEAVSRCLERTIRICREYGVKTSICGQAPSVYSEVTRFLVKCGIDKISVNPDVIEQTRALVAQVEHKLLLESNLKIKKEKDNTVL
ncbi:Phosphoenolpyruvate synthase [Candidatus Tiddalikarchaeum anstoanum]|nr:Phosphoenolpyruvate synthase [Candidatus Tiddalikarchaeum anstoanum]